MNRPFWMVAALLLLCAASASGSAAAAADRQLGVRLGMDMESHLTFRSYEVYGMTPSPWPLPASYLDVVELQFETALGVLEGEGQSAATLKVAPQLTYPLSGTGLTLVASSGPTLLSRSRFGDYELGGRFHFTSNFGIQGTVFRQWTLGVRVQHLSNARTRKPNPGLNLMVIEIARRL